MSTDVRDLPSAAPTTPVAPTVHRRRGTILLAIAVWQVWLWVTRAWNLAHDPTPRSSGFIAVHVVLYTTSFAMAVLFAVIGWRMRREAQAATSTHQGTSP